MGSYTREEVTKVLPVGEMWDLFNAQGNRGTKAAFFALIPGADVKNIAHQFTETFKPGSTKTTWATTDTATLDQIVDAWNRYKKDPSILKKNGSSSAGSSSSDQPTGTQQRRAEEDAKVPPVTPNILDSVIRAAKAVRDGEVPPPEDANDAYNLLWDHLDETVRAGRASGIVSAAMARLSKDNPDLFAGIFTMLSPEVQNAILAVLETKAQDVVDASRKTTVEDIFHVSKGGRYAAEMFSQWDAQVQRHTAFLTADNDDLLADPTEEQIETARKAHLRATLQTLARGLQTEINAAKPEDAPKSEDAPILFETISSRIKPEEVAMMGRVWGGMTPAAQRDFIATLDAEDAAREREAANAANANLAEMAEKAAADAKTAAPEDAPKTGGRQPKTA